MSQSCASLGSILIAGSSRINWTLVAALGTPPTRAGATNSDTGSADRASRRPEQIDGEHAAPAGEIADVKLAAVRFDAATADGQPQTETRSLGAQLLEGTEELFRLSFREPAAFVLDTDQDAIGL